MREGGLAPDSDSYDTTGVDGPGLVKEGRDKESNIIQPPLGMAVTGCMVAVPFLTAARVLPIGIMTG